MAFSTRSLLGLAMPAWEAEFGWTKSAISGAGAIGLIVMAVVAPFVGHSIDRYGARPVIVSGMVMIGLGSLLIATMQSQGVFFLGFAGISAVGFGIVSMHAVATAIAPHFNERRGLATGITSSGATGGQLLFVPLFSIVASVYSWREGYWMVGGGTLALALICWISLKTRSASATTKGESQSDNQTLRGVTNSLVKSPVFHGLFWSFALCGFTTAGVIETHLLPYASICGYGSVTSASAYGILSAFNLVGMIVAGYLSDRMNGVVLLSGIYLMRAASFILLMFIAVDVQFLFLFAIVFGLFDYSTVPVTANLTAKHLGLRVMGLTMGVLAAGHALGAASGAYLGGVVYDYYGSYSNVWLMLVGLAALSGFLVVALCAGREEEEVAIQTSGH